MTLERLNNYRLLQIDIKMDLERQRLLEAQAYAVGSGGFERMPSSNEPHSRTERYAIELAELHDKIRADILRKCREEMEIREYIEAQDAWMRMILKCRFELGWPWVRVAHEVNLTEDAAKKAVYRHLRKEENQKN